MSTGIIANPLSAGGRTGKRWNRLRRALEAKLDGLEIRFTEGAGHATELTRELLWRGCDRIVGVGGDGTFNEIANGFFDRGRLIRPDACLGLVPTGTGGDFQRSLQIPSDPDEAIAVLVRGRPLLIDLGTVTYRAYEGQTRSRYFVNLTSYRGKPVDLMLDDWDRPRRYRVLNVAVGNGPFHGGGMHVCPRARFDDGVLEVTVIDDLSVLTLIKDVRYLYNGNIYEHPKVRHFRARSIKATSPETTRIEVDGEPVGTLPLEITILPRALPVLVAGDSTLAG